MAETSVEPTRRFARTSDERSLEAWAVDASRFGSDRPRWQHEAGGLVDRLHEALRAMRATPGDILTASFSHPSRLERPDVENRLFTNVKDPPEKQ